MKIKLTDLKNISDISQITSIHAALDYALTLVKSYQDKEVENQIETIKSNLDQLTEALNTQDQNLTTLQELVNTINENILTKSPEEISKIIEEQLENQRIHISDITAAFDGLII